MAKPKIKNSLPSADAVWSHAKTLLEVAYRMESGQFDSWRSREDAHLLLDRVSSEFEVFNASKMKADDAFMDAQWSEYFISTHIQCHKESWTKTKLKERLAGLFVHDVTGEQYSVDDVPEVLVNLTSNPSKDSPQGVVEDANYTWSKFLGSGKGDTILKGLRRELKAGNLKLECVAETFKWIKSGEYERFQDAVTQKLFGWNRNAIVNESVKMTADHALSVVKDSIPGTLHHIELYAGVGERNPSLISSAFDSRSLS